MLDPAGSVLTWNLGAERITGYRLEEVLGRPASFFYPSEEVERGTPQRHLLVVAEMGRFEEEGWRVRKDGSRFLANVILTSLRDERGHLRGFSMVTQDITDRRRAEQEREQLFEQVQAGRTRLQALSHQLITTQEVERRHIARELHDEIGQALSTLKILIQRSRQSVEPPAAAHLEEGVAIVNQTIDQVRTLSLALRPSVLDDLGLIPALRWFVDNKARQGGFVGEFVADPMEPRLTPDRELVCFRLVQEALTNVMRHAGAKRVIVALTPRTGCLEVVIRDDGSGFDVAQALTVAAGGKTMGLLGMQERVALVGGELEIRSARGGGSEIRARFPLMDGAEPDGRKDKP